MLKCVVAILYYEFHRNIIQGGDIFLYLNDAEILHEVLLRDPMQFIRLVFGPNGGSIPPDLAQPIDEMGHWGNISAYFMVRVHAMIRLLSFGHDWVHGIFMAFISFSGICILIHTLNLTLSRINSLYIYILFLLPSLLFWTSGYHKETIVTLAFPLYFYGIFNIVKGRLSITAILSLLIGASILLILRDFFFWLSLPPLISLILSLKFRKYALVVFAAVYFLALVLGTSIDIPGKDSNYLEYIDQKRSEYMSLKVGNTHFDPPDYKASLPAFIYALPESMLNGFFRPFPSDTASTQTYLALIENILIVILILLFLLRTKVSSSDLPFLMFLIFLGLSIIIATGLIVPNSGAILRYRSVGLLLFLPAVMNLRPDKTL
ncbi:MAG: hypothetical protein HKN92_11955 [Chitinophagales bacterium]|nr:hypothetical protein [Chitinophagales bacterium]